MRWIDAFVEVQLMRGQAMIDIFKFLPKAAIGFMIGGVITLSALGPYYGPEKLGIVQFDPCWRGRSFDLSLGNRNTEWAAMSIPEWGPPYFRMRASFIAWPGGVIGTKWNNAGFCDGPVDDDTAYTIKSTWIDTHPEEWRRYVLQHPQEGKTWYGRGWKRAFRQFRRNAEN